MGNVDELVDGGFGELDWGHHGVKLLVLGVSSAIMTVWAICEIHIILFI